MTIKSKVKGFISIKNINLTNYGKLNNKSIQQLSRTYSRDSIKLKELLDLCVYTDCHIAIVDNKTGNELITFNQYDITDDSNE